ncbi:MAG: peptidoglycan-binding domain-containing protein [Clostridia bacterium]
MDLLKTILIYMSMIFVTSVQTAPDPAAFPDLNKPTTTPYVEMARTPTPLPTASPTPVPTINITPNPEYKTIRVGDRGEDVKSLQQKLLEYGYYKGDVDGRFGNQTRRAVEQFQYQHGLDSDGIAGKRTLTVLYESDEIRKAPQKETPAPQNTTAPSAKPTTTTVLAPAITDEKTKPTSTLAFVPIETTAPTASESPTAVKNTESLLSEMATTTPIPEFLAMEGYSLVFAGSEKPLQKPVKDGEAPAALVPYTYGDVVYVPFLGILQEASMNIITSDEKDEYGFALGESLFRIAFAEDRAGLPINLEAYRDNEPQILPVRDIRFAEEMYYFPMTSMESLTGVQFLVDVANKRITVTLPVINAE